MKFHLPIDWYDRLSGLLKTAKLPAKVRLNYFENKLKVSISKFWGTTELYFSIAGGKSQLPFVLTLVDRDVSPIHRPFMGKFEAALVGLVEDIGGKRVEIV